MTENEAKRWLKHTRAYQHKCDNCEYIDIKGACNEECKDFYEMAIQALSEIQQYRAIGTVDECKLAIDESIDKHNLMVVYKDRLKEFEDIGTVEDFKALKEKNTPKKIAYQIGKNGLKHEKCPTCGSFHVFGKHCTECGQAVDYD